MDCSKPDAASDRAVHWRRENRERRLGVLDRFRMGGDPARDDPWATRNARRYGKVMTEIDNTNSESNCGYRPGIRTYFIAFEFGDAEMHGRVVSCRNGRVNVVLDPVPLALFVTTQDEFKPVRRSYPVAKMETWQFFKTERARDRAFDLFWAEVGKAKGLL